MSRVAAAVKLFYEKSQRDGVKAAVRKSCSVVKRRIADARWRKRNPESISFYDVLFVDGSNGGYKDSVRYRIDHQIQQLEAAGLACGRVDSKELTLDIAGSARNFILVRCCYTSVISDFIETARSMNKRVYVDVDDASDSAIHSMVKILGVCDGVIVSARGMVERISIHNPSIFVNRNVASEEMLYYSDAALGGRSNSQSVTIGCFVDDAIGQSDVESILPVLLRIMQRYPDVSLLMVGNLSPFCQLEQFGDRVRYEVLSEWRQMLELMASVDINVIPVSTSEDHCALTEKGWIEASLVKTPTVAGNVEAFSEVISQGVTGCLCNGEEEWFSHLSSLIEKGEYRAQIGACAQEWCRKHASSVLTGHGLAEFLRSRQAPNIHFTLPSLNVSGGVLVAMRHAGMLQAVGYDVTLIDNSREYPNKSIDCFGHNVPVLYMWAKCNKDLGLLYRGRIDQGVATMWSTVYALKRYTNLDRVSYLVQGYEPVFYEPMSPLRPQASATYDFPDVTYLTVSRWCRDWLWSDWGKQSRYVLNGIECDSFNPVERSWVGKIRILIEGDSSSSYKNVDEAFRIVDKLDESKYEIWYMSYHGEPKPEYRVDRFFHKVPYNEVPDIYKACHILLKTSLLESFSYPPLEMMATGGMTVAILNEGNSEYLVDGYNCLLYESGALDCAVSCVERIVSDETLRSHLQSGGFETARSRDWSLRADSIVAAYGE